MESGKRLVVGTGAAGARRPSRVRSHAERGASATQRSSGAGVPTRIPAIARSTQLEVVPPHELGVDLRSLEAFAGGSGTFGNSLHRQHGQRVLERERKRRDHAFAIADGDDDRVADHKPALTKLVDAVGPGARARDLLVRVDQRKGRRFVPARVLRSNPRRRSPESGPCLRHSNRSLGRSSRQHPVVCVR